MKLRFLCLSAALALAACNVPTVPDFTYYRLPKPQSLEAARTALDAHAAALNAQYRARIESGELWAELVNRS